MDLTRGQVVRSKAGRDKDRFLLLYETGDRYVTLVDGKERPLCRPKRKNVLHIQGTNTVLDESVFTADKRIRKALSSFNESLL